MMDAQSFQAAMSPALPARPPDGPLPAPPQHSPAPEGAPQRGRSIRWAWWIVLALAASSVGYVALRRADRGQRSAEAGGVRTARVTRGDLRRTLRLNGGVGAKGFATLVAPRLRGRQSGGNDSQMILIKLAKPGASVKKGDVVAEFDRQWQMQRIDDQKASVVQAEAAIAKRQAELDVLMQAEKQNVHSAQADWEKAKLDVKTEEIRSQIDAEKLKLAVEETSARYRQLQEEVGLMEASQKAEIRALEIVRDRSKIDMRRGEVNAEAMIVRAPLDGIGVMQMVWRAGQFGQVQEGDQVWPGTPFLQIVNPAAMVVNAAANQAESQDLRLGQAAEIRLDAYPDQVWRGRLISLGAMAGGAVFGFRGGSRALYVRQIPVRFLVEAQDRRLLPDLSASAAVVLQEEKNVLIVPLAAMQEENGKKYARVKETGGWQKREVQLGLTGHTEAAARAGLGEGEEVALEAPDAVGSGAAPR